MQEYEDLELIIRADANEWMGAGHLMRCLALGQAWQDVGGHVTFLTACENEAFLSRLRREGFGMHRLSEAYPDPNDWETTQEVLSVQPDAWVVVDGYHFDTAYQKRIKDRGHKLLVIDDMAHLQQYMADLLLNQNIHATSFSYRCEPHCRLLLGADYVLLRREFQSWGGFRREIPEFARRVLVTLGGADVHNVTLLVLKALRRVEIDGLEVTVVVGAGTTHRDEVERAMHGSPHTMHLVHNTVDMPKLLAWADLAVSGGGSTCWELAFMKLPSLVFVLADNQEQGMAALEAQGSVRNLGCHSEVRSETLAQRITDLALDTQGRAHMAAKGQALVDGLGGKRVVKTMLELGD